MFKKILCALSLAAASGYASAGYIQYNISGPALSGVIIQHDDDKSIAYYKLDALIPDAPSSSTFKLPINSFQGEGSNSLTGAKTSFLGAGPTNFTYYGNFGGDQFTNFKISFSEYDTLTSIFTAQISTSIYFTGGFQFFSYDYTGLAKVGVVDPIFASNLDYLGGYSEGVPKIVPQYQASAFVPEPSALALLLIGALGAGAVKRRRFNSVPASVLTA